MLLKILSWLQSNTSLVISILSFGLSCFAFIRSGKANKIAENANTLTEISISHSKEQGKIKTMQVLIDKIEKGWGNANHILITEWIIHKKIGYTVDDFNQIWELATFKIKKRKPKISASEILKDYL